MNIYLRSRPASLARVAAAAVALLLVPSLASARGGGGGGGHSFGGGGFGGGGHSFGGRGFGGGYGGLRGYGGYGGYHSGYYGYHSGYYGGGYYNNGSDAVFLWIIGGVVAIYLLSRLAAAISTRRTLSVITLVLSDGARYTQVFGRLTRSANFERPEMRNYGAHDLFDRINEHDILAAYVHTLDSGADIYRLGEQAKQIWQTEMEKAEVKPDLVNVSSPGIKVKATFAPARSQAAQDLPADGCCLVSVIVVASGLGAGSSTDRSGAVSALHRLHSAAIDAFYFYFTPSAGESMPRYEAIQVLEQIHGFAA